MEPGKRLELEIALDAFGDQGAFGLGGHGDERTDQGLAGTVAVNASDPRSVELDKTRSELAHQSRLS
jgi:hypothetical protein